MCSVRRQLGSEFAQAVADLAAALNQQLEACAQDNFETRQFEDAIAAAIAKRAIAKEALLAHLREHGCD